MARLTELPKPPKRGPKPRQRIKRGPAPKRTTRPRKHRKTPLAKLKRELWALLSAYVKERDGNVCFSCGATDLEGKNWHAGHLFPAGSSSLIRYDPNNVHPQNYRCNINLGGNGAAYADRFIERFGLAEFMRLSRLSRCMKAWKVHEIQDLIDAMKRSPAEYEMLYAERYGLSLEAENAAIRFGDACGVSGPSDAVPVREDLHSSRSEAGQESDVR